MPFLDDAGAEMPRLFIQDLKYLVNKAAGRTAPFLCYQVMKTANGLAIEPTCMLEFNVSRHDRSWARPWVPQQVSLGEGYAIQPTDRLSGMWMRQLFYVAGAPDNTGRLHVAETQSRLISLLPSVDAVDARTSDPSTVENKWHLSSDWQSDVQHQKGSSPSLSSTQSASSSSSDSSGHSSDGGKRPMGPPPRPHPRRASNSESSNSHSLSSGVSFGKSTWTSDSPAVDGGAKLLFVSPGSSSQPSGFTISYDPTPLSRFSGRAPSSKTNFTSYSDSDGGAFLPRIPPSPPPQPPNGPTTSSESSTSVSWGSFQSPDNGSNVNSDLWNSARETLDNGSNVSWGSFQSPDSGSNMDSGSSHSAREASSPIAPLLRKTTSGMRSRYSKASN